MTKKMSSLAIALRTFGVASVIALLGTATTSLASSAAPAKGLMMELTPKSITDVSDANFCGDYNVVKVFDLSIDETDVDQNGRFVMSEANLALIQKEAKSLISFNDGLFVAHRGGQAIEGLTSALGLTRNRHGSLVLTSCHDLAVLDSFKLKVDRDRLVPIDTEVGENYFTLGVQDPETQDAQYLKYHMFVDLSARQLTIFTVL